MQFLGTLKSSLKSSSMWFVLPSLILALSMGVTISAYEPLSFDPSRYATKTALAEDLDIDTGVPRESVEPEDGADAPKKSIGDDDAFDKALIDGTYTGYAACGQGNVHGWQPYYVAVTIEVKDAKVAAISDIRGSATGGEGTVALQWDAAESQRYLDRAIDGDGGDGLRAQMESQIRATGSVSSVDVVSGATFSSTAIYNAYVDAVGKAGGEGGVSSMPATLSDPTEATAQAQTMPVTVASTSTVAAYADGDWTGYAVCGQGNDDGWSAYYVAVTVRVSNGRPAGVTRIEGSARGDAGGESLSWDPSESGRYLGWAIGGRNGGPRIQAQMNDRLAAGGSVTSIDTVSGATFSSDAIVRAYGAALQKSAAAAGSRVADVASAPSVSTSPTRNPSNPGSAGKKPHLSDKNRHGEATTNDDPTADGTRLADGTWTGFAVCGEDNEDDWPPYYVSVRIAVEDGKVKDVSDVRGASKADGDEPTLSWNEEDNGRYLDWACNGRVRGGVEYAGVLDQARTALTSGSSLGDIDAVSGATYSSNAIVKACVAALKKSAEAAGSAYDEPKANDDESDADKGHKTDGDGNAGNHGRDDTHGDDQHGGDGESGDAGGDGDGDSVDAPAADDKGAADTPNDADDSDAGVSGGDNDGEGEFVAPAGPVLVDGDYVGHALCEDPEYEDEWDPYYVLVSVRVQNGSVEQVVSAKPDDAGEVDPDVTFDKGNSSYFARAINGTSRRVGIVSQIQSKLDAGEEVTGIDVVSGATFSSRAVMEAYRDALARVPHVSM